MIDATKQRATSICDVRLWMSPKGFKVAARGDGTNDATLINHPSHREIQHRRIQQSTGNNSFETVVTTMRHLYVVITSLLAIGLSNGFLLVERSPPPSPSTRIPRANDATTPDKHNETPRSVRSCASLLSQKSDDDFWSQQKELMNEMATAADLSLEKEEREKFARRRLSLVGDTAYVGLFIFCGLWSSFDNPFVALSYMLGTLLGLLYTFALGKIDSCSGFQASFPLLRLQPNRHSLLLFF